MSGKEIAVSVVVATYNRADILAENIESVFAQDYGSFEAVYVDDGSTDATPEVLRQAAERSPVPFRVVRTENLGPGRARNAGVAEAAGAYILFLDDDATAPPHWIGSMVARCEAHGCDVLCGGIDAYSVEEPVAEYLHLRMQRSLGPNAKPLKAAPTGNLLIKRAAFEQVGGFAEERLPAAEDWELSHRLREAGFRIMYDPAVSVVHRYQSDLDAALRRMRTTGAVGVYLAPRMYGNALLYTLYSVARFKVSPFWIVRHYPRRLWWLAWRMEAAMTWARVKAFGRMVLGKPILGGEDDNVR